MGAGDIGLPVLRHLAGHPHHPLIAVLTQPDKPVGRKRVLTPPRIKCAAQDLGVPVFQPERIRHAVETLRDLTADVFVVFAYGQILPQAVLDLPRTACLNLHASLLPKYRGASPIQAAIAAGDRETAMTVMYMNAGLDTGDVLLEDRIPIHSGETGASLHDRLAALAPQTLGKALSALESGDAPRHPQDHRLATHTKKLRREDGGIDWTQPAAVIERLIRAYHPWPGTSTTLTTGAETRLMKIFPPSEILSTSSAPGTLLECEGGGIVIACGTGALRLSEIQPEGRRRMTTAEFLAGHPLPAGFQFGVE